MGGVGGGGGEGQNTYDRDDALRLEQVAQTLDELLREQIRRLGTPGEDVVNDVAVCLPGVAGGLGAGNICHGISDDGGVVLWEGEVLRGEGVDDGVDFYSGGVDTVGD